MIKVDQSSIELPVYRVQLHPHEEAATQEEIIEDVNTFGSPNKKRKREDDRELPEPKIQKVFLIHEFLHSRLNHL